MKTGRVHMLSQNTIGYTIRSNQKICIKLQWGKKKVETQDQRKYSYLNINN